MNDKPRAEISVDVEILEVNRGNAKQYGLDLSSYQVGLAFSPEVRPDADTASSIFNLNTISNGVSAADFYASVPSAVIRFLEQDSETKVIAKPNLRGSEGEKLSLKLGEELPVPSTTFYNPYGGGNIATTPLTSFTYKNVGVNLDHRTARDLRRRHHPEGRPGDQRQGPRPERRRPESAVVLLAQGRDEIAAARRGVEPARRAAAGERAQDPQGRARASPASRSCGTCSRRTTRRSCRPTSSCCSRRTSCGRTR